MRNHRIPSRAHVQGTAAPLRLRHSANDLTDGAGLLLVRQLFDRLRLGERIAQHAPGIGGRFQSPLMIESWTSLLLYGGGAMDDLKWLSGRGVRSLFGWAAVPDPTTFGRWLRRGGVEMVKLLDHLTWYLVCARWAAEGTPTSVMLVLDSTVVARYGEKQAGAERGYNPKKKGRPSHHPLLAFTDGGDCLGVRWRAGSAHTAEGAGEWVRDLVERLRQAGVQDITVRLDKGFFSKEMVSTLTELGVSFVLKVPDHKWVRRVLGGYRQSEKDTDLWTATGELYGVRLCSVERRRLTGAATATATENAAENAAENELALETYEVDRVSHVLTNIPGIHALTAWREYNRGTFVEQRIKELYQLGFGRTAVDDLSGNAILAGLGVLAYQVLHVVRTTAMTGEWRCAQPARLRAWLFRLPAKLTTHARKRYVQLRRDEPLRKHLLSALRGLGGLAPPETHLLALG